MGHTTVICLYFLAVVPFNLTINSWTCINSLREQVFLTEPKDVHVTEGEIAIFSCSVGEFDQEKDYLTWALTPSIYMNVISESYNNLTKVLTSTITIFHVGRKQQTHQCILQGINPDGSLYICPSGIASMVVKYFPNPNSLTCGSTTRISLRESDLLEIWCKVDNGIPTVDVSWWMEESIIHDLPIHVENETLLLRHQFRVSHLMHNKSLLCLVTSIAFPTRKISCTVGPFKVLHKPELSIIPSNKSININKSDFRSYFTCVGDGYPPADNQILHSFPPGILLNENPREVFIDLNTTAIWDKFTDITLTCSASNSQGMSVISLNVTLLKLTSRKQINTCKGAYILTDDIDNFANFSNLTEFDFPLSSLMKCGESFKDRVDFEWLFDDFFLKELLVKEEYYVESFIYIRNISTDRNWSLLKCVPDNLDRVVKCMTNISILYLLLTNVSHPQLHQIVLETEMPVTLTKQEISEYTFPKSGDRESMYKQTSNLSQNASFIHKNAPTSTTVFELLKNDDFETDKPKREIRISSAIVVAVAASIIFSVCLVAMCNFLMFRYFGMTLKPRTQWKCETLDQRNNDSMYEEPTVCDSRSILRTKPTGESENSPIRNYVSSESDETFSISSTSHSHPSPASSHDSHIGDDYPSAYFTSRVESHGDDDSQLSGDSSFSFENEETIYECCYDNQTVVEMHRIGKPRTNPTERDRPSMWTNMTGLGDTQFELPPFPSSLSTGSATSFA